MIEPGRRQRVGGKLHVKPGAPAAERGMFGGNQRLAADEEGRGFRIDGQTEGARFGQGARHIGHFKEAVMDMHRIEPLAELFDRKALFGRHKGGVVGDDLGNDDALVQHLVMLEIVQQRAGNCIGPRRQEHGRPRNA